MKILALNSSPRGGGRSKTELMLNHLVEGMRCEGAEVEIVNLREKNVKPCIGCFTCWTKTPGRCIQKDDMTHELFPKWLQSDLVVCGTPLYYHFMNGTMSTFRERTLPAVQPFFALGDGITYHPLRQKIPAMVWLSVCGFPEASEFDALSDFLNRTRHKDVELVAEIYRPSAERLTNPLYKETAADILEATAQAGRELVRSMNIAPETMARIRQPMVDSQSFVAMGNLFWKTCIAEGVTPKEFGERKMVPRPDSLESFMILMPFGLDSEAGGNKKAILQFKFSGSVAQSCYFIIENGKIDKSTGTCENPDLTIETPFDLWMDIMTKKADARQMLMEKKYTVTGDIALMAQLFKQDRGEA